SEILRELVQETDVRTNPSPEPYQRFVMSGMARPASEVHPIHHARLRYIQRWRALVPGIDLRATFLCGDRFIIGSAVETFCVDRATGQVLWRRPTTRGVSIVTPGGIARLYPNGQLDLHDFITGEIVLRSHLEPRVGGVAAGTSVHLPGLPRLLIVTS